MLSHFWGVLGVVGPNFLFLNATSKTGKWGLSGDGCDTWFRVGGFRSVFSFVLWWAVGEGRGRRSCQRKTAVPPFCGVLDEDNMIVLK